MRHRFKPALATAATVFFLSACGGGGSDGGNTPVVGDPGPVAPTTATLSGVAATGRPFADATVTVFDSTSNAVGTTKVATDGTFSVPIPASAAAPLVLEATSGSTTLVSALAETKDSTVNITPLTNVIAARLAPDGDPLSLRRNPSAVTPQQLAEKVQELKTALAPIFAAVGDTVDPLTGSFAANGTGHDQVLDALDVQIRAAGAASNIEITVRGAAAESNSTIFSSNDPQVPALKPVATTDLPPPSVNDLVDDLTARMTACFALPLSQRVVAPSDTGNVVGTAAEVRAPQCRSLFVGDDPAGYLSNGARVGRDASNNGAFTGLFRSNATGVAFDSGNFEFVRGNPEHDVVFTYRTVIGGNETFDQLVARVEAGKLKLVGNQYIYSARVRPIVEDREFLNQPAASYVYTGYDLTVFNQQDANGRPIFSRAEVTSPSGQVFTLKPNAGRDTLNIVQADGSISQTPAIALASKFRDPTTAGSPAQFDTGLVFASPALTDAQLRDIPALGVWKVEFFHVDPAKPNVVQNYRTIARAPTTEEALLRPMAQLTDAAKAQLRARSASTGVFVFGPPSAAAPNVFDMSLPDGADFWTVPAGAQAPTLAQVFGRGPDPDGSGPQRGAPFNDTANVNSTARSARILCSRLGTADTHCDNSTGVNQYALNTSISVAQVFAVSRRQEALSKINALYFILPR